VNIEAITAELTSRLAPLVDDVYSSPPASPVFPCAIIDFPEVETFHIDSMHNLARLRFEVEMNAGRGDTADAYSRLAQWVSTDTPLSVEKALIARQPAPPWARLRVESTQGTNTTAESVQTTFIITIDA
jgi:hypothetical protein